MHRAIGNSRLGRKLVSMKKHTGSGGVVVGSAVAPKAGWKFVELRNAFGFTTVAKIRSYHHVERVNSPPIPPFDVVIRLDPLE